MFSLVIFYGIYVPEILTIQYIQKRTEWASVLCMLTIPFLFLKGYIWLSYYKTGRFLAICSVFFTLWLIYEFSHANQSQDNIFTSDMYACIYDPAIQCVTAAPIDLAPRYDLYNILKIWILDTLIFGFLQIKCLLNF